MTQGLLSLKTVYCVTDVKNAQVSGCLFCQVFACCCFLLNAFTSLLENKKKKKIGMYATEFHYKRCLKAAYDDL